jgi:hypothetical protein
MTTIIYEHDSCDGIGVLGRRPKWLVTISLHYDLLAVHDTYITLVWVFVWEPLLYNGGLRVLGCSPSGEALATLETLIYIVLIINRMHISF